MRLEVSRHPTPLPVSLCKPDQSSVIMGSGAPFRRTSSRKIVISLRICHDARPPRHLADLDAD